MKRLLLFVVLSGLLLGWTAQKTYAQAVTGVTLNKHTLSLDRWAGEQLVATVSPADAANKNVNWQSSNDAIVSVDGTGYVSANHDGVATVFVKTEDGGFTDSCVVTCRVDNAANIVEFSFAGESHATSIADDQAMVNGYMPYGTDASNLTVANYQISPGASINPLPETIHDFSDTVSFVVTAPDGKTQKTWKVYTMILPDLSGTQKVELNFSTAPQGGISDTVSWEESNIHFHVGYPNPSDTSWPPSAAVGVDQDYSGKIGIALFPANLQFYLKDTSKVIVAASMYILENCGDSCSFVYFQGENAGKTWYIDKMTREYHFYDLHQIKADYGKFRSFEGSFSGITFWIASKDGSVNHAPVADAGPDQTVTQGDSVYLDGTGSFDPDGDSLRYQWLAPGGITLTDPASPTPSFKAPETGSGNPFTLSIALIVNDGKTNSEHDTVFIRVNPKNRRPVAFFDIDTDTVVGGDSVSIAGHYSYDPDGDSLSFHWSSDLGSGIAFFDSTAMDVRCGTPVVQQDTTFLIYLRVDDGSLVSEPDTFYLRVLRHNSMPVADAGPDQTVFENDTVHLDGTGSYDPDGDPLTYLWKAPVGIVLDDSTSPTPSFTAPVSEIPQTRTYPFVLVVNDGKLSSPGDTVIITVQHRNNRPVAWFDIDSTWVNEGDTAYIDGHYSYDPDGDSLSFHWSTDPGSGIVFFDSTAMDVRVGTPAVHQDTVFRIYLKVDDGKLVSKPDTFYLKVKNINHAPVAKIVSTAQTFYGVIMNEGDTLWIDGSPSYDPDGDSLSYDWALPKVFRFYHYDSVKVMVIAPSVTKTTSFDASLFVKDPGQLRSHDDFIIQVRNVNHAPVADAGKPFHVLSGKTGHLDGSGSGDPDGDSLRFTWIAPAGITLSDNQAVSPTFVAPEVTDDQVLTFALVVSDGRLLSDTAWVEVTVKPIAATMSVTATLDGDTIAYRNRHITLYWKNENGRWVMENILSYNENGETYYAVWQGYWMITVDPVGDNAGFVSTFSGDVAWWAEENDIFITGGTETHVNIHCIAAGGNLTGDGMIDGYIQRDTTTAGVARSSITHVDNGTSGDVPAAGVTVYLYRSSDDLLLASALTDEDGRYVFDNLPFDAYYLLVQLPGYDANTPWPVEVTENDTVADNVNFLISEGSQEITGVNDKQEMRVKLYPNPVKTWLNIRIENEDRGSEYRIYDITGHLMMRGTFENVVNRLDIGYFHQGIYLLNIHSQNKVMTRRILKQ